MVMKKNLTTEGIDRILADTKASLAVEDLHPSRETIEVTKMYLSGSLTDEEAIQAIKSAIENSNRLEK